MKFYHVTLDPTIIEEFVPRVPDEEVMVVSEDRITPRICLAKTIRGCITAVPWGGSTFEDKIFDNGSSPLIRVYEFDSEDISEENLISSKELYQTDRVRDAEISGEVWVVNQSLKPKKTYLIQVNEFREGIADDIAYQDLINLGDDDNLEDIINGCFTTIEWIKYDTIREEDYSEKLTLDFNISIKEKDVNKYEDKETYDFLAKHFGINANSETMSDSHFIYDTIDRFVSENWQDRNIVIRKTDKEGVYKVELYVDLSDKPTTQNNFLELIKDDIAVSKVIEFID